MSVSSQNIPLFVSAFSLQPNKIVLFDRYIGDKSHGNREKAEKNLKDNTNVYGELSENAERRLKKSLDYLLYLSGEKNVKGSFINKQQLEIDFNNRKDKAFGNKDCGAAPMVIEKGPVYEKSVNFKLTFITLTLASPQIHSDNEIKSQLLNQFLTEIRAKFKVKFYIWKAEKQQNKNIHFHILSDKYIHWRQLRNLWNRIQNKLGYVDRYRGNMLEFYKNGFRPSRYSNTNRDKRSINQQIKAYKRGVKTDWRDPNSTDIHALYRIKNLRNYMAKYLAKGTDKSDELRKDKMKYLRYRIEKLERENNENIYDLKGIDSTAELESMKQQFQELREMGVDGRIWGQSQILSKFVGVLDIGNLEDIKGIDNVELIEQHKDYIHETKISNDRTVTTIYIDFSKIPALKNYFDGYVNEIINTYLHSKEPKISN